MNPVALISVVIAITSFLLAVFDRVISRAKKDNQLSESIANQQKQIDNLREICGCHERSLTDIRLQCAKRIAETSTTEQMRIIVKQEMKLLPDMIIAELYERGIFKK